MRAEIREMQATIHARGEEDFTASDFDAMPYTIAVMKVSFLDGVRVLCSL